MKFPWHRFIAVWEIIGGIAGAAVYMIPIINSTQPIRLTALPLWDLVFSGFFILCAISGLLLWNRSAAGVNLSKLVQLFQIPDIVVKGIAFRLVVVLSIPIGLEVSPSKSALSYAVYQGFHYILEQNEPEELSILQVNLIALGILILLFLVPIKKATYIDRLVKRGQDLYSE